MDCPIIALAALLSVSATTAQAAGPQPAGQRGAPSSAPRQAPAGTMPPQAPARTPIRPSDSPPIVLPLPPLTTLPAGGLTPGFRFVAPRDPTRPRRDLFSLRGNRRFRSQPYSPFVGGYGGYPAPDGGALEELRSRESAPATGMLRLSVTPETAQVFVDSYYVGTVDDINAQRALVLEAGPHRIEFRSDQYQTLEVDVRILPLETVTYRGALEPVRPAIVARAPSPNPLYLIPNCYLGNVPPRAARLPAGCDIKKVQVVGAANPTAR